MVSSGGRAGDEGSPCPSAMSAVTPATRTVHCQDALPWLKQHAPLAGCSFITSLPDVSGMPELSLDGWQEWFVAAAQLTLAATPDAGVTIFYPTDVKVQGTWVDKSQLCHRAAERQGTALIWHKIVCRKPAGQPSFGRPAYSHMLCYSRGVRDRAVPAYPDVLPVTGKMTWSQAMGLEACQLACRYVLSHTETRTIVDPFCGLGSVLAVANELGMAAVGVELSPRRARKARGLRL
jgi:hypothetical protein